MWNYVIHVHREDCHSVTLESLIRRNLCLFIVIILILALFLNINTCRYLPFDGLLLSNCPYLLVRIFACV